MLPVKTVPCSKREAEDPWSEEALVQPSGEGTLGSMGRGKNNFGSDSYCKNHFYNFSSDYFT